MSIATPNSVGNISRKRFTRYCPSADPPLPDAERRGRWRAGYSESQTVSSWLFR